MHFAIRALHDRQAEAALAFFVFAILGGALPPRVEAEALARGDADWQRRAEGEREGQARPEAIQRALRAYEEALAEAPDGLEARWKLLRALHFAGDFALPDAEDQRRNFERGREVSEEGLRRLARQIGSDVPLEELDRSRLAEEILAAKLETSDVARLYFWSAINWGAWSRRVGLLDAVRQGVANRLNDLVQVTIALEPGYEDGGAYRLLGRLHAELPRVPFVSSWVDRDRALPLIERGYDLAPDHPGNRLLLALTLLDLVPEKGARRSEAIALLKGVAGAPPRAESRVEDRSLAKAARERLAAEGVRDLAVEGAEPASFSLPEPGSQSRVRNFCGRWLDLTSGAKQDLLQAAEVREADRVAFEPSCRAGLRGGLRHKLDAECRNWSRLMDFEVRAVVDGFLAACPAPAF